MMENLQGEPAGASAHWGALSAPRTTQDFLVRLPSLQRWPCWPGGQCRQGGLRGGCRRKQPPPGQGPSPANLSALESVLSMRPHSKAHPLHMDSPGISLYSK